MTDASPVPDGENAAPRRIAELLRRTDREFECRIEGGSMRTTLPDGTRIRVRSGGRATWEVDDVIAFLSGVRLIVHRIVRVCPRDREERCVITLGDGMVVPDPPIRVDAIVGLVSAVEIDGRWCDPPAAPARRRARAAITRIALGLIAWLARYNLNHAQRLALALAVGATRVGRLRRQLSERLGRSR